jgi:hypothetical protein
MARSYEFVQLEMPDGSLHGLTAGNEPRLAIHIHGTWGNFYENPFALGLSDTYTAAGWSYASVNNRGHDGGSVEERYDASLPEIAAWVDKLAPDDRPVILQGHSLGALKILRLLHDREYSQLVSRVSAVVLLSPFDLVAFNGGVGDQLKYRREKAMRLREEHGGEHLVESDMLTAWPLSVGTYLEATTEGGRWDLLPTRDGSAGALRSVSAPLLVAIGGSDVAQYPDPALAAEVIAQQVPDVRLVFIDGAPHNFAGHEAALQEAIGQLVESL